MMNRPLITEFMGDGFTLDKAHKQYLENIELWNYVQALDKYTDDLEEKLSERQAHIEINKDTLYNFAVWLTGHNKETIQQMYNDWNKHQ